MNTSFSSVADERLFLSSRDGLVRSARRLVGPADAEDVVQDAFERALRATLHAETDPRPWLYRIARNVAYDALRSRSRAANRERTSLVYDAEGADERVLRRETAGELEMALRALPENQRRTIVLHDFEGYTGREIAALDGTPYHTVRTRLFRARIAMRRALTQVTA